jgi:hypothetical protein
MKNLVLALALSLGLSVASAEIVPAESVKDAQVQAEAKCKEGCLVLSPAEITELEIAIQMAIQEAYQAGLKGWSKAS